MIHLIHQKVVAGGILVAMATAGADASPVTWEFTGQITNVVDETDLLGGTIAVGTPFNGSFTFETATPDADPADTSLGVYEDALSSVFGNVGAWTFQGPLENRSVIDVLDLNLNQRDRFRVTTRVAFQEYELDFFLILLDGTATVFSDDSLPASPPSLDRFNVAALHIVDTSEQLRLGMQGNIVALVPEPSSLALLLAGAMVVWRSAPRARRRPRAGRRGLRSGALVAVSVLIGPMLPTGVRALDCNNNTIDDDAELAACPTVEIVILMDKLISLARRTAATSRRVVENASGYAVLEKN